MIVFQSAVATYKRSSLSCYSHKNWLQKFNSLLTEDIKVSTIFYKHTLIQWLLTCLRPPVIGPRSFYHLWHHSFLLQKMSFIINSCRRKSKSFKVPIHVILWDLVNWARVTHEKSIRIHRPNRRNIRSSNHLPLLLKKIYSINTI